MGERTTELKSEAEMTPEWNGVSPLVLWCLRAGASVPRLLTLALLTFGARSFFLMEVKLSIAGGVTGTRVSSS